MSFSQPSAGGDQFDAKDYNGRLLIVYPKSFAAETPTAHGISPSADVDIVVVDAVDPATGQPKYFQNARLFGNLAKSVSRDLGGAVLGRLGQVPTQRGNPAWVLQNFTDQDAAMAGPADAAYKAGQFKQPENPMAQQPQQAPPAQQWQQQAPAPQQAPQQYQQPPQAAPAPQQQFPAQATQQQWSQQPPASAPPQQFQQGAVAGGATAQGQAQVYQQQAPAGSPPADPGLVARIQSFGIPTAPGITQAEAEAINATLPQQGPTSRSTPPLIPAGSSGARAQEPCSRQGSNPGRPLPIHTRERNIMSDEETPKRTRTPNPFTAYKKAKAAADKARRAHERADDLREKAEAAAARAEELREAKEELEAVEQAAYDALQEALEALDTDTDEVADDEEDAE